jgi:hypothetical protein
MSTLASLTWSTPREIHRIRIFSAREYSLPLRRRLRGPVWPNHMLIGRKFTAGGGNLRGADRGLLLGRERHRQLVICAGHIQIIRLPLWMLADFLKWGTSERASLLCNIEMTMANLKEFLVNYCCVISVFIVICCD